MSVQLTLRNRTTVKSAEKATKYVDMASSVMLEVDDVIVFACRSWSVCVCGFCSRVVFGRVVVFWIDWKGRYASVIVVHQPLVAREEGDGGRCGMGLG